jgi:hypothetical protein
MAVPLRLGGGAPGPWARPARWLAHAWRRLGWRQVALAALLAVAAALLAPNGGMIVLLDEPRRANLVAGLLAGRWITIVPLVFAAMLADEASRDGVRPVLAYSLAFLLGWSAASALDALGAHVGRWWTWNPFRVKHLFVQSSLVMAVYGYARTTRHVLERIQRSEADRIRDRQQLLAARRMALQARSSRQFLLRCREPDRRAARARPARRRRDARRRDRAAARDASGRHRAHLHRPRANSRSPKPGCACSGTSAGRSRSDLRRRRWPRQAG